MTKRVWITYISYVENGQLHVTAVWHGLYFVQFWVQVLVKRLHGDESRWWRWSSALTCRFFFSFRRWVKWRHMWTFLKVCHSAWETFKRSIKKKLTGRIKPWLGGRLKKGQLRSGRYPLTKAHWAPDMTKRTWVCVNDHQKWPCLLWQIGKAGRKQHSSDWVHANGWHNESTRCTHTFTY